MRIVPLGFLLLLVASVVFAGEIREFDLKTTERLGNGLVREMHRSDRGATNAVRQRARQTAVAALKGRLIDNVRYDYVVLDDPDGSGFLVYALATTNKTDETILGGHFRISVSSDGSKVERIDALQREIIRNRIPAGAISRLIGTVQMYSNIPVETYIYSSNLYHLPIFVRTKDNVRWVVTEGKIHKLTKAELEAAEKK